MLERCVSLLNDIIWSRIMLIIFLGTGLCFTVSLHFFQFRRFKEMWKGIFSFSKNSSGISVFESFCATMASRIGTGNVAGVALAISLGGPGAMVWMWVTAIINSSLSFVECTLAQLYKTKIDGYYRGGSCYCILKGLSWKKYASLSAIVLSISTSCFLPAAASYSICDSINQATGISKLFIAIPLCLLFLFIVIGKIKRISKLFSLAVPFMTLLYLSVVLIIVLMNIKRVPEVISMIFSSAIGHNALFGGIVGSAFVQGVKRGSFSSAAGMGESTSAAAVAVVKHPIKQGFVNAGGVWLDTLVCTATGISLLLTGCFNVFDANAKNIFNGNGITDPNLEGGIEYVQQAFSSVLGNYSSIIVSVLLFFFAFTCIIGYYYEAESALLFLLQDRSKRFRLTIGFALKLIMSVLVLIYSIVSSPFAWNISDLAFGICAWTNVVSLWALSPKVIKLYSDYETQLADNIEPIFKPSPFEWKEVDNDIWKSE